MQNFLSDMKAFLKEKDYNVYSFAAVKGTDAPCSIEVNGANPCQDSYSVAKAFTVTALAILCDRGLLSYDEYVIDVLKSEISEETMSKMDKRWQSVTVHHALLHRLGLPDGFLDIDALDSHKFGKDFLSYMLTYPLIEDPCVNFRYTDGAYYMLARIAEIRAGMPLDEFLWRELFFPLGFSEAAWSKCPLGHTMGATGLYIRSHDMVKLGALYMNGGEYMGHRILSENAAATVLQRGYELNYCGVGRGYGKGGMRGQMLAVFPDKQTAVAWHAYNCDHIPEILTKAYSLL